jgi:O-antigen/teichoic acid export membrane protein
VSAGEADGPRVEAAELQRGAIRGSLWTILHVIVSLPLAFGVNVLVARVLGVVDYGRLGILTTVMAIATTAAGLGVSGALLQFGAKEHAAGRDHRIPRLVSSAQGYYLMVTMPLVSLAVLLIVRVEPWLLVTAVVFGVVVPSVLQTGPTCLALLNRTDVAAKLAMVVSLVTQLSVIAAVLLLGTPDAVWSSRIIATGVLLTLPFAFLPRFLRRAVLRPRPPWRLPRSFWAFAVPMGIANLVSALVTDRTELVLLNWLSDPVSVGLFALAFGLASQAFAPAQAFVGPLLPALSGLAEAAGDRMERAFLRATRAASVVGGGVVVSVLPALAALVPTLYGEEYAPAAPYLVALGATGGVVLAGAPHYVFLMARLGGVRYLSVNLVALVLKLGFGLLLIPVLGVWGAVVGYALASLTRSLWFTVSESRQLKVRGWDVVKASGPVLLAVVVLGAIWGVASLMDWLNPWGALGLLCAGPVLWVAMLRITRVGLDRADADAISSGLPAWLARYSRPLLRILVT